MRRLRLAGAIAGLLLAACTSSGPTDYERRRLEEAQQASVLNFQGWERACRWIEDDLRRNHGIDPAGELFRIGCSTVLDPPPPVPEGP